MPQRPAAGAAGGPGPPQAPIFLAFLLKIKIFLIKFSSKSSSLRPTSSLTAQHSSLSLAAPVSPTPTFLFLALGPCCTQPLNLRQSLLARCWRCRPQYCDCSSLACRAASICCASHAAASSKAAPPLSGATKFSHCLHEHVSCLARRTIRAQRVRCVRAED